MINWRNEEASSLLPRIDYTSSPNSVIVRKFLGVTTRQFQEGNVQFVYNYEMAFMTLGEFLEYSKTNILPDTSGDNENGQYVIHPGGRVELFNTIQTKGNVGVWVLPHEVKDLLTVNLHVENGDTTITNMEFKDNVIRVTTKASDVSVKCHVNGKY